MLDTLASMPRQELIILLSVSVGSLVLLTILLTVLCIYCCRRANTARGRSNKSPVELETKASRTSAFTFKTLLRHYANRVLTPH